jgi:hypothetical protein
MYSVYESHAIDNQSICVSQSRSGQTRAGQVQQNLPHRLSLFTDRKRVLYDKYIKISELIILKV